MAKRAARVLGIGTGASWGLALAVTLTISGCNEQRESPTTPAISGTASRSGTAAHPMVPGSRRSPRAYHLHVDRQKREVQIASYPTCDPEVDPNCEAVRSDGRPLRQSTVSGGRGAGRRAANSRGRRHRILG